VNLSVLMSVYAETRTSDLSRCLNSLSQQTLPATEIVMVRDGPILSTVERCIQSYESTFLFQHLSFTHNRGLGPALRDGIKACNYDLIARVDSDDWSIPERFQKQAQFLHSESSISVVGGGLKEHYGSGRNAISVVRQGPMDHASIQQAAKRRNPMNHPTVMFRKNDVLACNSYEFCPLFEDYYLWAKMLTQGYLFSNLPEALVETDIDSDYFRRRGGVTYVRNELRLVRELRQIGFLSPSEASVFILSRLPIRLLPVFLRQYMYKSFLRANSARGSI
jgi:glycosyltransferase involved in cell wall biosynthesis